MSERRQETRNPCYLRAEIIVAPNADPVLAEAHDISDHGLRLVVLNAKRIPNEFVVSIPRRRMREAVRMVRREDQELGVIIQQISAPA